MAELTLRLRLDCGGVHTERSRPAAPTLDVVLLMNLVRLRLESLALGAGVTEVRVASRASPTAAVQQGLFVERPRRDRDAAERALARVRAEFGDEAVVRALLREAHLPEARFVWEPVGTVPLPEPARGGVPADGAAHPCPPDPRCRRAAGSRVGLPVCGTQRPDTCAISRDRIWSLAAGGDSAVRREYYFVRLRDGDMLWVYYDRRRRRWRWQGQVE